MLIFSRCREEHKPTTNNDSNSINNKNFSSFVTITQNIERPHSSYLLRFPGIWVLATCSQLADKINSKTAHPHAVHVQHQSRQRQVHVTDQCPQCSTRCVKEPNPTVGSLPWQLNSALSPSLPSYRPGLDSVEFVTIVILLQADRLMAGLINCGRKSFDLWTVVIPVVHSCRCSCSPGGAGHKVVDWALFWARLIEIQNVMINVEQCRASAQRS